MMKTSPGHRRRRGTWIRRSTTAAAVVLLLLQGAPAEAAPPRPAGRDTGSAPTDARTPKPNYPQPEVTIPVESPGCADKTRRPVTLPDGTRATATPGSVRVDPSRLGQPGSRASTPA